jgi:competence protein ComEA
VLGATGRPPSVDDEPAGTLSPGGIARAPVEELRTGRPSRWQRLAARLPVRLDPGRRGALAVGLAVLVAAIGTGLWLVVQRPRQVSVGADSATVSAVASPLASSTSPVAPSGAAPGAARATPTPTEVVVDVAGKVRHPGLYRLPPGSRVDDAVKAAGGPLSGVGLTSLNLAARVADGQQVVVGVPGAAPAAAGSGAGGAAASSGAPGPVNLNAATLEQLESLPGVGPVLAQHILDWRTAHGSFTTVDQLQDVSGIGPAKFAALHDLVTV